MTAAICLSVRRSTTRSIQGQSERTNCRYRLCRLSKPIPEISSHSITISNPIVPIAAITVTAAVSSERCKLIGTKTKNRRQNPYSDLSANHRKDHISKLSDTSRHLQTERRLEALTQETSLCKPTTVRTLR